MMVFMKYVLTMLLVLAPRFAFADRTAESGPAPTAAQPTLPAVPSTPSQQNPNDTQGLQSLMNILKAWDQQNPPMSEKEIQDIEANYKSGGASGGTFDSSDLPVGNMPFQGSAESCGKNAQQRCSPSHFGGRTMCGLAVSQMIKCMAANHPGCTGKCGNGKDFVSCGNGQMVKCGYKKMPPGSTECKMPGAVLAYTHTPTARGSVYGHVEFVCGRNQYCSVYSGPHNRPWPRAPADACWYPVGGNGG
jgi:hypothetical protein